LLFISVLPSQAGTVIHVTADDIPKTEAILQHLHDASEVSFATGNYFFTKPIELPDGIDLLTLQSDPHAKVTLSAGQLIQGWKRDILNGHDCYSASLVAVQLGIWDFRELWVNGRRATRCRYPATGYLSSVQPADDKSPWNQGQNWFGYKPGDLPDTLDREAEALIMNRWEDARLPVQSVDSANHRILSSRKTVFHPQDGDPYYLQGASQWFEHPGDWYLDHATGNLYYLPRQGENLPTLSAIAPTRDHILLTKNAKNLILRNLIFSHTEWNLPQPLPGDEPAIGGFAQAEFGVPAAVEFDHCRNCRIDSCSFIHLGNYALLLGQGCQNNRIERCSFADLGAGAIKIGETDIRHAEADQTFANSVSDCRIKDGGHLFPSACGIWVGQSADNRITHNEISDLYSTAISIGWTWGYGPSLCKGNLIDANLIHDIGKKSDGDGPILSDMGAIYTLGARAGTVISNNVCHDIVGRVYGGWGIYLDEGSSDVLVEKNRVFRTTHGGFHINYGQNNLVRNNIFALGRDLQIARTRVEPGLSVTFKNNIVSWNTGRFTATDPGALDFDQNLYHCFGDGKLLFADKSLDQWKAAGRDPHSILADPRFLDPQHGNFSMPSDSPATQIHFEQLSIDDAGPRTR
jgi:parallel beta-helix repeat protein